MSEIGKFFSYIPNMYCQVAWLFYIFSFIDRISSHRYYVAKSKSKRCGLSWARWSWRPFYRISFNRRRTAGNIVPDVRSLSCSISYGKKYFLVTLFLFFLEYILHKASQYLYLCFPWRVIDRNLCSFFLRIWILLWLLQPPVQFFSVSEKDPSISMMMSLEYLIIWIVSVLIFKFVYFVGTINLSYVF